MARSIVALAVIGCMTLGTGIAEAVPAKGSFRGTTVAKNPVGLKLDSRGRVYSFFFEGVPLACSDGEEVTTPTGAERFRSRPGKRFRVGAKRRWRASFRDGRGAFGWNAAGRFSTKGTKVTGTLRVSATFDEQDNLDPDGSVRCESGKVGFALKRAGRARGARAAG